MIKFIPILLLVGFQSYSQTYNKSGVQNGNGNYQNNTFIINKSDSAQIVKGIEKLLKKYGYDKAQFNLTATAVNSGNNISFAITNNSVIGSNNHIVGGDNNGINGDVTINQEKRISHTELVNISALLEKGRSQYHTTTRNIWIMRENVTDGKVVSDIVNYLESLGYIIIGTGLSDELTKGINIAYNTDQNGFVLTIGQN